MRKYKKGNLIRTVAEYEEKAKTSTFFIVRNQTLHKGWIESWQYHYLKMIIYSELMYEALPNKEGVEKWKE